MGERMDDGRTRIEQRSDVEVVVTRVFDAPVRLVYDAWTKADLFKLWWAPKSLGVPLVGCEMDVRTGGGYSVTFARDGSDPMTFYGKYIEVVPLSRLVWTNEESGEGSITTVTFEAEGEDRTRLVMRELYPSKEAFDAESGSADGAPEQFAQLDELLVTLGAGARG